MLYLVVRSHVPPLSRLLRMHCRQVIRINMAIVRDMTLGFVKAEENATRMPGKTDTKKGCRLVRPGSKKFLPISAEDDPIRGLVAHQNFVGIAFRVYA
mgnify:CR=1 FL=1